MQMNSHTITFLPEAATAVKVLCWPAPYHGDRRSENVPALAGRYAS